MLIPLFGALIGVGLFVAVVGIPAQRQRPLERLATLLDSSEGVASREETLTVPFTARLVLPVLSRIAALAKRRTPRRGLAEIDRDLISAGNPWRIDAAQFAALQIVVAATGLIVGVVLATFLGLGFPLNLVLICIFPVASYLAPRWKLRSLIKARHSAIRKALPSTLDFLTIGIEAGLAFDAAVATVIERQSGPLATEFTIMLNQLQLGRQRNEVLRAVAERVRLDDLSEFIDAVILSQQMGMSLGRTMRLQSEEMRRRRRQRAEELGVKAPVKMLFPMAGCMFPTLFVVLLGPAVLIIFTNLP